MSDDRRVIVIGSGPSGAMAALALLRKGIPVTMLESGFGFPGGLLVRAMGRNVMRRRPHLDPPRRHVSTDDPHACWYHDLVPGGLSNYWTGAVPRFAPDDFCEGERLHERYRWPLAYADLVPYYEQAERLLVVVGNPHDVPNLPAPGVTYRRGLPRPWQRIAPHAAAFGHGLTSLPLADGAPWMARRTATAFNSFTRIVPLLRRFRDFQLLRGAHALRLEWCGAQQKVRSLLYYDRAARAERRMAGAAVVVAAGALSSTKLLLDSACADFPAGLGNTEGLLGRYLHDHPHQWFVVDLDRALPHLGHAAYLTRAPYGLSAPLCAAQCTIGGSSDALLHRALSFTPLPTKSFGVVVFGTMVPVERNHVRPDPVLKDEFGLPVLDLHIRFDADVPRTMAAARDRLLAILDAAGYPGRIRGSLPALVPGASVHYGGTVRMHSSPRHGMLNAWNRLHSVENVVVADASCFTTGVEKNPVLTAMALAARAAERLAADLKAS
jgi:choline dehydrogenase-like flavoprotein